MIIFSKRTFWNRLVKRLGLALALSVVISSGAARAQQVMMYVPVPADLISYVNQHMSSHLSPHLSIAIVDNDSSIWSYEPGWVHGISFAASGMERGGQIYLPVRAAVHLDDEKYRSVVVHELTHAAQETQNRTFACNGQREAQAYEMQNMYLTEHNEALALDPEPMDDLKKCGAGS